MVRFHAHPLMEIPTEPKKLKGMIIKQGNIPEGSVALEIARGIARDYGTNVVISDANATEQNNEDGLPTTIEVDNREFSDN